MSKPARPHVLLVDDDESLLHALVRVLRPTRRSVLTAASAEAAGALLFAHEVGVIVCGVRDTRLAAFLVEARKRHPSVARVILTGYPDIDHVLKTINAANPFKLLIKPWVDDELLATVKLAFAQYAVNRKRDRLIDEYAGIRANAERSHASHVLDALLLEHADMNGDAVSDLPVGVLLLQDGRVVRVNAAAQRFLAALGLAPPAAGVAVAGLPPALVALVDAALAAPRLTRQSHHIADGRRLDYFVHELGAQIQLAFAPAPRAGEPKF